MSPGRPARHGSSRTSVAICAHAHTTGTGSPARALAAINVLSNRHAIVIGPTPPGTGVIAPATFSTSAKATSPIRRDLPSGKGEAVDADVDHGGAGLDPVAAHHLGPADGREHEVGAAADGGKIARLRMRDGRPSRPRRAAVAPAACRRWRNGRSPRPRAPPTCRCTLFASITQPRGVQGTSRAVPSESRPAFIGCSPSTSLSGSIAAMTRSVSRCFGSGSWTRMPCTCGSAFSRAMTAKGRPR